VGAELLHADKLTDMTKLIINFRDLFESVLKAAMLICYAKYPCIEATVNAFNVPA
jgi:hypothetical protein